MSVPPFHDSSTGRSRCPGPGACRCDSADGPPDVPRVAARAAESGDHATGHRQSRLPLDGAQAGTGAARRSAGGSKAAWTIRSSVARTWRQMTPPSTTRTRESLATGPATFATFHGYSPATVADHLPVIAAQITSLRASDPAMRTCPARTHIGGSAGVSPAFDVAWRGLTAGLVRDRQTVLAARL
jgi:hypothetical protein